MPERHIILSADPLKNPKKQKGRSVPRIYPVLDTDLAWDNTENDIPAADLQDLYETVEQKNCKLRKPQRRAPRFYISADNRNTTIFVDVLTKLTDFHRQLTNI